MEAIMGFDRTTLAGLIDTHKTVARIVIVEVKGSTPRGVGTAMYVWCDGQADTIGGGALEHQAVLAARERLATGVDHLSEHPLGPALGQCCGGYVKLWTEIYDRARLNSLETGTVARPVISNKQASFNVQKRMALARNGTEPATQLVDGWFIEPESTPETPLWIWGAGHVGRALVSVLCPLPDFEITWVDTSHDRFPNDIPDQVTPLYSEQPQRLMPHAPQSANHIILTYSHALDLELCHRALQRGFGFAGLIGSETKWARFRIKLQNLGHKPSEIDRITCPIGLPALGKHPNQIAIGVAMELLQGLNIASQERKNIA